TSSVPTAPLDAASIITPMMLFALTRRPLRDIHTSEANWLASCVSFAEARACRPSLLRISTSLCCIEEPCLDMHHAIASAADCFLHHGVESLVAIGEGAHQHGKVDARHHFHLAGLDQLAREIARRGAIDVGKNQHAIALVQA